MYSQRTKKDVRRLFWSYPRARAFVDDSPEKVARAAALGMVTHRFTTAADLHAELVRLGLIG